MPWRLPSSSRSASSLPMAGGGSPRRPLPSAPPPRHRLDPAAAPAPGQRPVRRSPPRTGGGGLVRVPVPAGGRPVPPRDVRCRRCGYARAVRGRERSPAPLSARPAPLPPHPRFSPSKGGRGVSGPPLPPSPPPPPPALPAGSRGRWRALPAPGAAAPPPSRPSPAVMVNESRLGQGARGVGSRFKGPTAAAWGGFRAGIPQGGTGSLRAPPGPIPTPTGAREGTGGASL